MNRGSFGRTFERPSEENRAVTRTNGDIVDAATTAEDQKAESLRLSQEQDRSNPQHAGSNSGKITVTIPSPRSERPDDRVGWKEKLGDPSLASGGIAVEDEKARGMMVREDRNSAESSQAGRGAGGTRGPSSPAGDRDRVKSLDHIYAGYGNHRSQVGEDRGNEGEDGIFDMSGGRGNVSSVFRQRRLRFDRQQYEESVLSKSEDVHFRQQAVESLKRIPLKGKEPGRCKTHWDFVLEEMVWLSKDFQKERKLKISQAKRVVIKVTRSTLDVEAKELRRLKEEEQRRRRVASNIAKDVKKFWMKVEKLVIYKHHLDLEDWRKKALDKHLDFLVGQTERYSNMLAENLADSKRTPTSSALPLLPYENDPAFGNSEAAGGDEESFKGTSVHTSEKLRGEVDAVSDDVHPRSALSEVHTLQQMAGYDLEDSGELHDKPVEHRQRHASGAGIRERDDEEKEDKEYDDDEDKDVIRDLALAGNLTGGTGKDPDTANRAERSTEHAIAPDESMEVDVDHDNRVHRGVNADRCHQEQSVDATANCNEKGGAAAGREFTVDYADKALTETGEASELNVESNADFSNPGVIRNAEQGRVLNSESVDKRFSRDLELTKATAKAESGRPSGFTFLTTRVRTKLPFLLKHSLREYQHIGLDWLVTMYEKRLNGILADEMGLGKTIMTISLLAHLACDRGIWGPHLVVVPTSVVLNWEMEFMKWCPAFKILTYFGSAKERKLKRQGWSKHNSFHVCITTYRLVVQDAKAFRRKKWKYLILDEAHLIKNWKSQRWQTLLNFNSKRRILLTGTPLQNDLMELWSLMHFLMPHVFQSHQEFRDWFSNPIGGMVEGQEQMNKEVVARLHNVLRPFLLRRLKQDVEKQLPGKFEHVVHCRLSKRQRNLYEDFMANSDTQATLSSGNFLGLINVLMQLRKVCNHPDLFEARPITSSFDMSGLSFHLSSLSCSTLQAGIFSAVNLRELNLLISPISSEMTTSGYNQIMKLRTSPAIMEVLSSTGQDTWDTQSGKSVSNRGLIEELYATVGGMRAREEKDKINAWASWNMLRCSKRPLYGSDLRKYLFVEDPVHDVQKVKADGKRFLEFSSLLAEMVKLPLERLDMMLGLVKSFVFAIPAARAPEPTAWCSRPTFTSVLFPTVTSDLLETISFSLKPLNPVLLRSQLYFPDKRLLQFDCGKLQELAVLLRRLKSEGHRALIFTQMTKMLDILEGFISLYGYTYMRLDGSTKPEHRQILMQRFNTDPKYFLFILSTRSGGVGINLVGADTVIFYDSDWNPAMDQQAQDRCHRIGQTREVHIYRLVSEGTIEENILKKTNQKRMLDDLVIQSGSYNTDFFKKLNPMELFSELTGFRTESSSTLPKIDYPEPSTLMENSNGELSSADVEAALKSAEDEADYMALKRAEQEAAAETQEFTEEAFSGVPEKDLAGEMSEGKPVKGKNQEAASASGALKESTAEGSNKPISSQEVSQVGMVSVTPEMEEMDMLADVKQVVAAAATAGRLSSSFEDQLLPVERYAMRYLELCDPKVDKVSEAQVLFEEKEWELDQLEKLKEDQEADNDEEDEPLFWKSWDTTIANEAYRQQVEVLAKQQEDLETMHITSHSLGDDAHSQPSSGPGESQIARKDDQSTGGPYLESATFQLKSLLSARTTNKSGEQTSDVTHLLKENQLVTLDKEEAKDSSELHEDIRIMDPWSSLEDAVLCAVVHEYGGNWLLVSDVLAGMSDGGVFRGCHRHPSFCRDRVWDLLSLHAPATCSRERNTPNRACSVHLKLTAEHTKGLLQIALQLPLPDTEYLLQRHFAAVLRARIQLDNDRPVVPAVLIPGPQNGDFVSLVNIVQPSPSSLHAQERVSNASTSRDIKQLVARALDDVEIIKESGTSNANVPITSQLGNDAENDTMPNDKRSKLEGAIRTGGEIVADPRFRTATASGWGWRLYNWAAAATSGLGVSSLSSGKSRKRPSQADANKLPKPKRARAPTSTTINMPRPT